MPRSALFSRANEAGRLSRRSGAPSLGPDSTLTDVAAWLQWCDPNGCHVDEGDEESGYENLCEALEALEAMLEDDHDDDYGEGAQMHRMAFGADLHDC